MINSKYKQKYLKYKQKYIQALTKQKGGDTKKVLVLCQRKTGRSITDDYNVEDVVVPRIAELIQRLFGANTEIIYMTKLTSQYQGTVDIDCYLDGKTECSKEFISKNANSFDLIILQTCPLILNFDILINLLKPTGMIGFTAFPIPIEINTPLNDVFTTLNRKNFNIHEKHEYSIIFKRT